MNTMSEEERLKLVKTATRLDTQGSITVTVNGRTTTTEDVFIMDNPANSLVGFVGEDNGIVIVQFSSLTGPGVYGIKENNIWIHLSFNGFLGGADTGDLTLDTFVMKNEYKGSFNAKTDDHQKIDGVFDVRRI